MNIKIYFKEMDIIQSYEEKHHTLDINPDKMGGHTEEEDK